MPGLSLQEHLSLEGTPEDGGGGVTCSIETLNAALEAAALAARLRSPSFSALSVAAQASGQSAWRHTHNDARFLVHARPGPPHRARFPIWRDFARSPGTEACALACFSRPCLRHAARQQPADQGRRRAIGRGLAWLIPALRGQIGGSPSAGWPSPAWHGVAMAVAALAPEVVAVAGAAGAAPKGCRAAPGRAAVSMRSVEEGVMVRPGGGLAVSRSGAPGWLSRAPTGRKPLPPGRHHRCRYPRAPAAC